MFNNIKWEMPWSIYFRQKFGENGKLKCGDWCVRLVDIYGDKVRDFILETIPRRTFDDFYGLNGEYWIRSLMVMPNEELFIYVESIFEERWFQIDLEKCAGSCQEYIIKVQETCEDGSVKGKDGICEVELLNLGEFKKKMKVFEDYMEVFPFSLPLGECFNVNSEKNQQNKK